MIYSAEGPCYQDAEGTIPAQDGDPVGRVEPLVGGEIVHCYDGAQLHPISDRALTVWPSGEVTEWAPDPDAPVVVLNAENGWSVAAREGKADGS
jgi:hypothetical protein